MAAIGIGLVWVSYTSILYGYCLFRGYNVTPKQLLSPAWPPGGGKGSPPVKGSSTVKPTPPTTTTI